MEEKRKRSHGSRGHNGRVHGNGWWMEREGGKLCNSILILKMKEENNTKRKEHKSPNGTRIVKTA